MKSINIILAVAMALSGCSQSYDYSGTYEATKGDNCEVMSEKDRLVDFLTIWNSSDNENMYTARLSNHITVGMFPDESKPSLVAEDGSLTFLFFKDLTLSPESSIKMGLKIKMKITKKDPEHILIESLYVSSEMPTKPELDSSFDMVKDSKMVLLKGVPGQSNPLPSISGVNGLCLLKKHAD